MRRILACFRGGSSGVPRTPSQDEDAFVAARIRQYGQQQYGRQQVQHTRHFERQEGRRFPEGHDQAPRLHAFARRGISVREDPQRHQQRAAQQHGHPAAGHDERAYRRRVHFQEDVPVMRGAVFGYGQQRCQCQVCQQQPLGPGAPAMIMADEDDPQLVRAFSFGTDDGKQPNVLRHGNQEATEEDCGECAICYDELHKAPVSVLCDARGHRVCRHFYHTKCCALVEQSGIRCCPLCRQGFSRSAPVPSPLQNPRGWFQAVDADGSMDLDKSEVVDALTAVFPVDSKALAKNLDALWDTWDKTKSNSVTLPEFVDPNQGLLQWVLKNQCRLARQARHGAGGIPDIRSDRQAWFSYWDADGNGELDQEEVTKALLKTFRDADVFAVRNMLQALWTDFDTDNGGTIDREEFLRPNIGLLDTVLANLYNECI